MRNRRGTLQPVLSDRRRGRPASQHKGSRVSAWVPEQTHDRLARIARDQGTSVSSLLRVLVLRHFSS
jgi:hypothetical protein